MLRFCLLVVVLVWWLVLSAYFWPSHGSAKQRPKPAPPLLRSQVFCVSLWCLDEYWYYSIFTLVMLIVMECTVVSQRLRNLRELRALQTPKQALHVYRSGGGCNAYTLRMRVKYW